MVNNLHEKPPQPANPVPKIKKKRGPGGLSKSARSGLVFPVGRILRKMREGTMYRISDKGKFSPRIIK